MKPKGRLSLSHRNSIPDSKVVLAFTIVFGVIIAVVSTSACLRRFFLSIKNVKCTKYGRNEAWKIDTSFSGTRSESDKCGSISGIRVTNFTPGAMTAGMILGILEELNGYYKKMQQMAGEKASELAGSGNGIACHHGNRRDTVSLWAFGGGFLLLAPHGEKSKTLHP